MMEHERESFINISIEIMVADIGICDHDFRKKDKNNSIPFFCFVS